MLFLSLSREFPFCLSTRCLSVTLSRVQSRVCHVTALADAGSLPRSESNRMLTAVDITTTGAIVNKQFLKVTYSPF